MRIFFEDKHILVVWKEAGIAVEDANIAKSDLVSELKKHLGGGYLGVVHRLDMPVEGLLCFAKTKEAAAALSKGLSHGGLNKNYHALVCGKVKEESGRLVDYLSVKKLVPKGGKSAIISNEKDPEAKKVILNYKVIGSSSVEENIVTLLDISIETGRFHQIRAQLSHMGNPIVADRKYGNELSEKMARLMGVRNVALFADRISFIHPLTGERMEFEYIPENKYVKELIQ
ncbi:MAG: RluA family pseudouridine synthase [Lachnospiraceae bacterium]|nr:RluA family pseudouridine synthase [Lachnospiraceae bacterium]